VIVLPKQYLVVPHIPRPFQGSIEEGREIQMQLRIVATIGLPKYLIIEEMGIK